jgi:hypothetical protein
MGMSRRRRSGKRWSAMVQPINPAMRLCTPVWSSVGLAQSGLQIGKGEACPRKTAAASAPWKRGQVYARAGKLWEHLDSPVEFLRVAYGQSIYRTYCGELDLAQRPAEDLLRLSHWRRESAGLVLGH